MFGKVFFEANVDPVSRVLIDNAHAKGIQLGRKVERGELIFLVFFVRLVWTSPKCSQMLGLKMHKASQGLE